MVLLPALLLTMLGLRLVLWRRCRGEELDVVEGVIRVVGAGEAGAGPGGKDVGGCHSDFSTRWMVGIRSGKGFRARGGFGRGDDGWRWCLVLVACKADEVNRCDDWDSSTHPDERDAI